MACPPPSPPPSPPSPPPSPQASGKTFSSKRSRQSTRLKGLTVRHISGQKLSVSVDPRTGKVSGPFSTQFRSYLGTLAREKVFILFQSEFHFKYIVDTYVVYVV